MNANSRSETPGFFLAAAFFASLGWTSNAPAQVPGTAYLIDLDTGTATRLGTLGGRDNYPSHINEAGQVVGWSNTADASRHAFITGPDGTGMRDLGTLGGKQQLRLWHQRRRTGGGTYQAGGL